VFKHPILFAALTVALVIPAVAATPPRHHHAALRHLVVKHHAANRIRVAPADEYFGRLKMSILGIGNQLRDLDLRARYSPEKGADVLGSAAFVEDALHDWEHKYPQDPWLPKDVYGLAHLYADVHSDEGHRHATSTMHWLIARYGGTHYGRLARTELATTLK
jgi:hypothetical protein